MGLSEFVGENQYYINVLCAVLLVVVLVLFINYLLSPRENMGDMVALQRADDMIGLNRERFDSGGYVTATELLPSKDLPSATDSTGEAGYDASLKLYWRRANGPMYRINNILQAANERPMFYAVMDNNGMPVRDSGGYIQYRNPLQMRSALAAELTSKEGTALNLLRTPWTGDNVKTYGATCSAQQLVAGDPWSWMQKASAPALSSHDLTANALGTKQGSEYADTNTSIEGMDSGDPLLVAAMLGR